MFTAAVTTPASSSASKTVTASGERCSAFMLKIASRIDRAVPAARIAPKDEPYSTSRCSPRWYQTRCGMWWPSGCMPVASDERQTGVSDGNVVTARRYEREQREHERGEDEQRSRGDTGAAARQRAPSEHSGPNGARQPTHSGAD